MLSLKSGYVFERSVLERHVQALGTDPVSGASMSLEDIVVVRVPAGPILPSPTSSSVPDLLSTLQNEWDATVLEILALRKELASTREKLSMALYENDAAARVIARLVQERDEARA